MLTDFEYVRDRFDNLLKVPSNKRTEDNLYELMKLTSSFKIFEAIALNSIHKEICRHITLKVYEKGEIVFKQGDEGDAYYFLLRGAIDIYIYTVDENDGKIKLVQVNTVLPGHGFGELSLLYESPRTATCLANSKSDLIIIKKKIYNTYVKDLHEQELYDLMNFYSKIIIFKNESITNILRICLKTNKHRLHANQVFLRYGEYINDYYFVSFGTITAYIKVFLSKTIMKQIIFLSKEEFVEKISTINKNEYSNTDNSDVFQTVISVMEYKQGDIIGEYYASKQHKLNIYLIPDQPSRVISIKVDELKRVAFNIHDVICKYSINVVNLDNILSKLYDNEKWKIVKKRTLNENLYKT